MAGGGGKAVGKDKKVVGECTICKSDYEEKDGGIRGFIGMLPVSFCPGCLTGILEIARRISK